MTDTAIRITWQYMAGFFDGEGCIHIGPPSRPSQVTLTIVQANRNDAVLEKLQAFLEARHVHSYLQHVPPSNVNWLPRDQLHVCQYQAVRVALRSMLPYLIVKRGRAIAGLAHLKAHTFRRGETPMTLLEKARSAYHSGLSFRRAAGKYHIDAATLRRYMLRLGERGRTVSEAVSHWHDAMSPYRRDILRRSLRRGKRHQYSR